jgi:hypothetical protein
MLIIFMSLVSNPCAKDIYRILADDKKNNGDGVEFNQLKDKLIQKYEVREIAKLAGEMELVGVVSKGWVKDADGRKHMKYTPGCQTEWSALFANTLGYDPIALGIPADLANK